MPKGDSEQRCPKKISKPCNTILEVHEKCFGNNVTSSSLSSQTTKQQQTQLAFSRTCKKLLTHFLNLPYMTHVVITTLGPTNNLKTTGKNKNNIQTKA